MLTSCWAAAAAAASWDATGGGGGSCGSGFQPGGARSRNLVSERNTRTIKLSLKMFNLQATKVNRNILVRKLLNRVNLSLKIHELPMKLNPKLAQ